MKTFVVISHFCDNVAERRVPHREAHLAHLREMHERGMLLMGGALLDPMDAGMLIVRAETKEDVEKELAGDSYAQNGIWTKITVREWNVVVGGQ